VTLIDTHCHLAGEAYAADLEGVLDRAWAAGLKAVVTMAELGEDAPRALALARGDHRIRVSVGVHPHHADRWNATVEAALAEAVAPPEVVAVGEMGLDYHYDHSPRDAQRAAFHAQLALAARVGKPAVIHARQADDDVAAVLRDHTDTTVILHSYSSGPALLESGLAQGAYASFSGMVTFRNWTQDDLVRAVPADRLLIETDGPYLAPVPMRGKRNEPGWVRYTAERIAVVREVPVARLLAETTANARRVFGLN
jgi:TatD DNase family protein